jgi:hypothetical protein
VTTKEVCDAVRWSEDALARKSKFQPTLDEVISWISEYRVKPEQLPQYVCVSTIIDGEVAEEFDGYAEYVEFIVPHITWIFLGMGRNDFLAICEIH